MDVKVGVMAGGKCCGIVDCGYTLTFTCHTQKHRSGQTPLHRVFDMCIGMLNQPLWRAKNLNWHDPTMCFGHIEPQPTNKYCDTCIIFI